MWITCISLPNYFPLFHSATCSLFLCFTFNLSWIWIIPLTSTTWTRKLPQSQDQQRLSLIFSIACITLLPLTSSDPSRGKHNLSLCFPFFIFFYSFPIFMLYIFSTFFMHSKVLRETSICLLLVLSSLQRSPQCFQFTLLWVQLFNIVIDMVCSDSQINNVVKFDHSIY